MPPEVTALPAVPAWPRLRAALLAVGALFFTNGVLLASWAVQVPLVREALGLSNATLGLVLMGLTLGSVLILPVVSRALAARGTAAVASGGALLAAAGLVGIGLAAGPLGLVAALIVFGAGFGALDVALNFLAVHLEGQLGRPVLSRLHGTFSLGAAVGALVGGLLIGAGLDTGTHLTGAAVLGLLTALALRRALAGPVAPQAPAGGSPAPARVWSLPLALIALMAFCAAVGEGAVADWSGVYLAETVGSPAALAAAGFAGFSLAMMAGRFAGDALNERFGPVRLGRAASGVAVLGLGLVVLWPQVGPAVVGFAALGLGLSVVAPLAFSAAGRVHPGREAAALSFVAAVFHSGYLTGPPLIGALAHVSSLRAGWVLIALLLGLVALWAHHLAPGEQRRGG